MPKFYFIYGTSLTHPFGGGWTEVIAPDWFSANEVFEVYHPAWGIGDGTMDGISCVTDEMLFETGMAQNGNHGAFCHERISLLRELSHEKRGDK
ncbi:MAG: hypothetical protein K2P33_02125 [Acutalibacter sp.]|nr:hypothetical protein [Acutalibacter sp.]